METIHLISGSPRRQILLNQMGLPFIINPVDTEEYLDPVKGPDELARSIAEEKLQAFLNTDPQNVKWAVAISNNDIVTVSYSNGKAYNTPNLPLSKIDQYVIINGMENNVLRTTNVMPGTYDWIILLDHNDDGISDSYLGTIEKNIKLNKMHFLPGKQYKVTVTNAGHAFLTVE